jgi:hypothetical protein
MSEETTTPTSTRVKSKVVAPKAPANSPTTNDIEQDPNGRLENAKAEAMYNHQREHADDPIPTSGDRTRV